MATSIIYAWCWHFWYKPFPSGGADFSGEIGPLLQREVVFGVYPNYLVHRQYVQMLLTWVKITLLLDSRLWAEALQLNIPTIQIYSPEFWLKPFRPICVFQSFSMSSTRGWVLTTYLKSPSYFLPLDHTEMIFRNWNMSIQGTCSSTLEMPKQDLYFQMGRPKAVKPICIHPKWESPIA